MSRPLHSRRTSWRVSMTCGKPGSRAPSCLIDCTNCGSLLASLPCLASPHARPFRLASRLASQGSSNHPRPGHVPSVLCPAGASFLFQLAVMFERGWLSVVVVSPSLCSHLSHAGITVRAGDREKGAAVRHSRMRNVPVCAARNCDLSPAFAWGLCTLLGGPR